MAISTIDFWKTHKVCRASRGDFEKYSIYTLLDKIVVPSAAQRWKAVRSKGSGGSGFKYPSLFPKLLISSSGHSHRYLTYTETQIANSWYRRTQFEQKPLKLLTCYSSRRSKTLSGRGCMGSTFSQGCPVPCCATICKIKGGGWSSVLKLIAFLCWGYNKSRKTMTRCFVLLCIRR